ncbi:hypothetical protein KC678_03035 [Candidatus Dojkabacteria bacterium]|uniref:LVIVD repeat protein n=1 Tax=Candidatus Dojkabacteria bacterium TaxID=2099670 RepID=A0A955IBD4_9BACT|nr:hypothetical protein [Candidatus Dojkabacteria bacterium]
MIKAYYKKRKAFSSLEVILAIGLFSFLILALSGGLAFSVQGNADASQKVKAAYLAQEGIEAAKTIRGNDFANLADGTYGISSAGNAWTFSGTDNVIDEYTRTITVSTIDSLTKQIDSTVTWNSLTGVPNTITYSTYLTDWQYEYIGPPVSGEWSLPLVANSVDITGNQNARDIFMVGSIAYIVRSAGTSFVIYDLSDVNNPVLLGSSTAGVGSLAKIYVQGNYAYIVSDDNSQELQVFNVSNTTSPSKIASLNLPQNNNADSLIGEGNYLYIVRNGGSNDFSIVDITNPLAPVETGNTNIANGRDVKISGNYAYVTSDSNSQELQVIDISNKSNPQGVASYNLSGNANGDSILVYGNRAIIGTDDGKIHILNISVPLVPTLISSTAIGTADISDMELGYSNTYLFTVGQSAASEFIIADITNELAPAILGTADTTGFLNGLSYSSTVDKAFVVGDIDNQEIIIYEPTVL